MLSLFKHIIYNGKYNNSDTFYVIGDTVYYNNDWLKTFPWGIRDWKIVPAGFEPDIITHTLTECKYSAIIDSPSLKYTWYEDRQRYLRKS